MSVKGLEPQKETLMGRNAECIRGRGRVEARIQVRA